jgi:HEAT repeat protein
LVDIGESAVKPLTLVTEDENKDVRWGAARALKDIRIRVIARPKQGWSVVTGTT